MVFCDFQTLSENGIFRVSLKMGWYRSAARLSWSGLVFSSGATVAGVGGCGYDTGRLHAFPGGEREGGSMSETKRTFDDLTAPELIALAHAFFGGRRAAEILGYSLVYGVVDIALGSPDVSEYKRRLVAMGWDKNAAYRYFEDMRDFGKWLAERDFEPIDVFALVKRLGSLAVPTVDTV